MQIQDTNGTYREPEPLDIYKIDSLMKHVKRIIVFPVYGADGKPTPEMRRAWRRYLRTKKQS